MGICCQSLQGEGKMEGQLECFERQLGLHSSEFLSASRQLEVYSSGHTIESVRVAMLAHSVGVKIKGKAVHGSAELLEYLETGTGWSQRKAAVLFALCCPGSNVPKAAYLSKLYGTQGGGMLISSLIEMVQTAVHMALRLIPAGAKAYYQAELGFEKVQELTIYCDQLNTAAERVVADLLLSAPPTTLSPPEMSLEIFQMKVVSGLLRALCSASLLRRLARVPQKAL